VKVLRVAGANKEDHAKAAAWWMAHVQNSPYDWMAFPRLLLKAIFGDWFPKAAGKEWANWCTEGWANAWKHGAGIDVWGKTNPTPGTTDKRLEAGRFEDVTREMFVEVLD
jgi:hypothetical protein